MSEKKAPYNIFAKQRAHKAKELARAAEEPSEEKKAYINRRKTETTIEKLKEQQDLWRQQGRSWYNTEFACLLRKLEEDNGKDIIKLANELNKQDNVTLVLLATLAIRLIGESGEYRNNFLEYYEHEKKIDKQCSELEAQILKLNSECKVFSRVDDTTYDSYDEDTAYVLKFLDFIEHSDFANEDDITDLLEIVATCQAPVMTLSAAA